MRRHRLQTLLWAALATVLCSCGMPGRAAHPGPAAETGSREDGPHKRINIAEPQTIAAWEARLQSHTATLYALLPITTSGGGATTSPAGPPPSTRPYHPQTAQPGRAPTRATTRVNRSLRCRRICRHVRAICYAAKRICQIAARLGDESARAACERNQKRCQSARTVTQRRGCTHCGQANRPRHKNHQRRACLK